MAFDHEIKSKNLTQVVKSLRNHPAIQQKIDLGLNGTRLREQFIGLVIDEYAANCAAIATVGEIDVAIHSAYHFLKREYPYMFQQDIPRYTLKNKTGEIHEL